MDTKFWGPDGWKLLHSIAIKYPNTPSSIDKKVYKNFFNTIQYILPCIYCRKSLSQYYNDLPIDNYLNNRTELSKWLYLIHNKVNNKLRLQKLNNSKNPKFSSIFNFYNNYVDEINKINCVDIPGWNFLYTIVFNYPKDTKDISQIRYINYIIFFKLLPLVIPFNISTCLKREIDNTDFEQIFTTRDNMKKWFFKIEKNIKNKHKHTCLPYNKRCIFIEKFRAGCGLNNNDNGTCRVKANQ